MASAKEIRNHIQSVRDTRKITNAMYMISSAKLRKVKYELDRTRPYFDALKTEIKRIFRYNNNGISSVYFYPTDQEPKLEGTYACLVITADKGMAGAYNHNVIKSAMSMLEEHPDTKLYVVGEVGRQFFIQHGIPIEQSFLYPAKDPTLRRAREITGMLLEKFAAREFQKIYIIYTDMKSSLVAEPVQFRLLPFHRTQFEGASQNETEVKFEFSPSISKVLDNIIPGYVCGFIYSALVDSFCSEQNARMTAMDSASRNADKMLKELTTHYNRVRQAAITQEITEIAAGEKAQKAKKTKEKSEQ